VGCCVCGNEHLGSMVNYLVGWFIGLVGFGLVWLVSAPVGMYILTKFISHISCNSLNTCSHIL